MHKKQVMFINYFMALIDQCWIQPPFQEGMGGRGANYVKWHVMVEGVRQPHNRSLRSRPAIYIDLENNVIMM